MKTIAPDLLATFRLVIAEGSFSKAAERMGLSQPAVSTQIRLLEQAAGVKLIDRAARRVSLTAAGSELLAYAERFHTLGAEMNAAMARHATGHLGRVHIGTGASASIYLVPKVLKALRAAWPDLEIIVSVSSNERMVQALQNNSIDIGLLGLPVAGRMLMLEPLVEDELVLIAPPGLDVPPALTAESLTHLPLILPERSGQTRNVIDRVMDDAGISLKPIMTLGSFEAIKALVAAGLGAAIVPRIAADNHRADLVYETHSFSPPMSRQIGLVTRRDKVLHKGLRETMKALRTLKNL